MDPLVSASLTTLDQLKWFTETVLKGDLPEPARFYQTVPGTAHIHWLVGHVAFALDRITLTALEGTPALPETLQPQVGWGSKPVPDPGAYANWDAQLGYLYDSLGRVRSHVATLTDSDLAQPLPNGHPFAKFIPTRGNMIPFSGYHSCYHLGQVTLLRRAQGLPSGMQF
jgi:hypothetical protein